jgi:ADP-dependent NAD(P)H-hydrate dehydratase / NAD(P)H-hydrate epimerase
MHDTPGNRALESLGNSTLSGPGHHGLTGLMQRAGASVARLARAVAPHARQVWILAGPGNNGGDGFEAALTLRQADLNVQVGWIGNEDRLPADARQALQRARDAGVSIEPNCRIPEFLGRHDLVIDALLGRGLNRSPDGQLAHAITTLNRSPAPILAVDIPSGLRADSGTLTESGLCVQARWTLALLGLAPGLFTVHGRDVAGEIWWDDLGVDVQRIAPTAWLASTSVLLGQWPERRHVQHKGSFGDVWVIGGASGMGGAVLLAARAALGGGAGRVRLVRLDPQAGPDPAPELMTTSLADLLDNPSPLHRATVVAGCGGGQDIARVLPTLCEVSPRLILDADALNALAQEPALRDALRTRHAHALSTILTPHPLEAARLLDVPVEQIQAHRLEAAARLASELGCVVALKGSGTVVASPGQLPMMHAVGNVALASPGSGDVLAGYLGGLWSQLALSGPTLSSPDTARQAAHTAVHWHGLRAEALCPAGQILTAAELAAALDLPGMP